MKTQKSTNLTNKTFYPFLAVKKISKLIFHVQKLRHTPGPHLMLFFGLGKNRIK